MTSPQRYFFRVLLFLLLVAGVAGAAYRIIIQAFMHNPALNGLILGVLLIGIIYAIRRILSLKAEVRWIEAFRSVGPGFSMEEPPRLLAPVASVLGDQERRGRSHLSAMSMRYLLDSISARLDESRDITRYQTGLLIFLGLLGTFWGLLQTINAVSDVIGNLSLTGDDIGAVFEDLKQGLAAPMYGMGTAFSSSLFGLAGSLILGFIDLQATQSQNSFYNEMEEWLSGLTRLTGTQTSFGDSSSEEGTLPVYMQAMMQQTAENLERLRESVQRNEDGRQMLQNTLSKLNDRLGSLNERLEQEHQMIFRLVEGRSVTGRGPAGDPAVDHLRAVDAKLERLVEDISHGREQMTRELRNEIKLVTRTIAIAAGEPAPYHQSGHPPHPHSGQER